MVDAHVAAFGGVVLREPFVITCVCRHSLLLGVCYTVVGRFVDALFSWQVQSFCAVLIGFRGIVVVEKYNAWAEAVSSLKSIR